MRLGKQIPLDITNEMDICYGTTNRLNPQVIFVNGKFWIEPQIEMEYERVLNSISYNIKNKSWINKLGKVKRFYWLCKITI